MTIYFKNEVKAEVYGKFYDALRPGGYLFIGHSETMQRLSHSFEPIYFSEAVAYRKKFQGGGRSLSHE